MKYQASGVVLKLDMMLETLADTCNTSLPITTGCSKKLRHNWSEKGVREALHGSAFSGRVDRVFAA